MAVGIVKRSVSIRGHPTSVSVEDEFWAGLREIAQGRSLSVAALIAEIDEARGSRGLSSAIRLHVLGHFRRRAGPAD
jgi:predicted DNA-binding ribbon-helix-helix protein